MYDLPLHIEALPSMPEDGGYWSTLHSWVMPTRSFLEFMMFTRMFVDSLDSFYLNSSAVNDCLMGSTKVEVSSISIPIDRAAPCGSQKGIHVAEVLQLHLIEKYGRRPSGGCRRR